MFSFTYTALIQLAGALFLLKDTSGTNFPKRLLFRGGSPEQVWIHIHNTAAEFLIHFLRRDNIQYGRGELMNTIKENTVQSFIYKKGVAFRRAEYSFTLRRNQAPDKERPYFALNGNREQIILFLEYIIEQIKNELRIKRLVRTLQKR